MRWIRPKIGAKVDGESPASARYAGTSISLIHLKLGTAHQRVLFANVRVRVRIYTYPCRSPSGVAGGRKLHSGTDESSDRGGQRHGRSTPERDPGGTDRSARAASAPSAARPSNEVDATQSSRAVPVTIDATRTGIEDPIAKLVADARQA